MAKLNFFTEETDFTVPNKMALRAWINDAARAEGFSVKELNFIFCSDAYLLEINQQYLDHDTLTDIITFDHSEQEGRLHGDIFISIDRVTENAQGYGVSVVEELHRVMIHGVMHLCGYADHEPAEKERMTEKEDQYLRVRESRLKTPRPN